MTVKKPAAIEELNMEHRSNTIRVDEFLKSRENDIGTPILLFIIAVVIFVLGNGFLYIFGLFFGFLFLLAVAKEFSKYNSLLNEYEIGEIESFLKAYPEWKMEFESLDISKLKYKDLHKLYKKLKYIINGKAEQAHLEEIEKDGQKREKKLNSLSALLKSQITRN